MRTCHAALFFSRNLTASPTVRMVSAASSDLAAEFFLEGHHKLDGIETVSSKIVDEACILGHFVGLDPEMLHHDLLYALRDIAHIRLTVLAACQS